AQRPAISAAPITAESVTIEQPVISDRPRPPASEWAPEEATTVEPEVLDAGPTLPRHARQEVIEAPLTGSSDGLPRRIRQTNLAPQLRDAPAPADDETGPGTRSPEDLRTMMSSFQAGTNRGRRDAETTDSSTEDTTDSSQNRAHDNGSSEKDGL